MGLHLASAEMEQSAEPLLVNDNKQQAESAMLWLKQCTHTTHAATREKKYITTVAKSTVQYFTTVYIY